MNNDLTTTLQVIPAIVGLVTVCTKAGLPTRLAALVAIGFGLLAGVYAEFAPDPTVAVNVATIGSAVGIGVAYGLAAMGLYNGADQIRQLKADSGSGQPPTGDVVPRYDPKVAEKLLGPSTDINGVEVSPSQ